MAADSGLSHTTIRRIWTAFGLQPHRAETFKLSSDPLFVDKVQDIVGLYMSPPDRAIVLCVDEKSQIQALDRADGAAHGRTAHPYLNPQRHDIAVRRARHRHRCDDRPLLQASPGNRIPRLPEADRRRNTRRAGRASGYGQLCDPQDAEDQGLACAPPTLACSLHANVGILDQSGRALVRRVTRKQLQRGVHRSTAELEADIDAFIQSQNESPTPYKWVKSADQLLASVKHFCQKTMNRTSDSGD